MAERYPPTSDAVIPAGGIVSQAAARYGESPFLRSVLQILCPGYGPIDAIVSGLGAKFQAERTRSLLTELSVRLKRLEGRFELPTIEPSEEWIDFIIQVHDYVIRSRSREKHRHFAQLVTNQAINPRPWDEAEIACRMIGDLTDHHIRMLDVAMKAPVCDGVFDGLRVVTFSADETKPSGTNASVGPSNIRDHFLDLSDLALRMICSELVARGLFFDTGIGGFGHGTALRLLVPTDLSEWLLDWIREPQIA